MCRHMYDWNIVNCDVKQPIHLTSSLYTTIPHDELKSRLASIILNPLIFKKKVTTDTNI